MTYAIAFFWIGPNISIPQYFVNSIRHVEGNAIDVYQLTDHKTPAVEGISHIIRNHLDPHIMVARLEAYAALDTTVPTYFFDADCLLINTLSLPVLKNEEAFLVRRTNGSSVINHRYPELYPEFKGRQMDDIMPFLFGCVLTTGGGHFFKKLLPICKNLPARFQRWYGDQVALFQIWNDDRSIFGYLASQKYCFVLKECADTEALKRLQSSGTRAITFKGPHTKQFIPQITHNLLNMDHK